MTAATRTTGACGPGGRHPATCRCCVAECAETTGSAMCFARWALTGSAQTVCHSTPRYRGGYSADGVLHAGAATRGGHRRERVGRNRIHAPRRPDETDADPVLR